MCITENWVPESPALGKAKTNYFHAPYLKVCSLLKVCAEQCLKLVLKFIYNIIKP